MARGTPFVRGSARRGTALARVYAVDTVMETAPASGAARERPFTLPNHILRLVGRRLPLEGLIATMHARLEVFCWSSAR
jgi:hypothetical protein